MKYSRPAEHWRFLYCRSPLCLKGLMEAYHEKVLFRLFWAWLESRIFKAIKIEFCCYIHVSLSRERTAETHRKSQSHFSLAAQSQEVQQFLVSPHPMCRQEKPADHWAHLALRARSPLHVPSWSYALTSLAIDAPGGSLVAVLRLSPPRRRRRDR
jgi:hypothetical protein